LCACFGIHIKNNDVVAINFKIFMNAVHAFLVDDGIANCGVANCFARRQRQRATLLLFF